MTDRRELADRLEGLGAHYHRRAELFANFANSLSSDDSYRPVADGDTDEFHQKAADLHEAARLLREPVTPDPLLEEAAGLPSPPYEGYEHSGIRSAVGMAAFRAVRALDKRHGHLSGSNRDHDDLAAGDAVLEVVHAFLSRLDAERKGGEG